MRQADRTSRHLIRAVRVSAILGMAVSAAVAGPYAELESPGVIQNNTLATAEAIPASAFTPNSSPDVFGNAPTASVMGFGGGSDVDFYSFVAPAGTAHFDIDGANFVGGGFDSTLSLFDSAGTLIGFGDNSTPNDPGSVSELDGFIGIISIPVAGTYYVALTRWDNLPTASATGSNAPLIRPDLGAGGFEWFGATLGDSSFPLNQPGGTLSYELHISLTATPIPAPTAALLAMIGLPLIGWVRRRVA